jgi:hypothetical protein
MQSKRKLLWLLGLLVAGSACADLTGAVGKRRVGILSWEGRGASRSLAALTPALQGAPTIISAPDTVRAGEAFEAVITTIGPDGCWKEAGAEIKLTANLAIVTPYDIDHFDPQGERGCFAATVELPRTVQIRFSERGEAILRVHGRKIVGADLNQQGTPVTAEKKIFVR